MKSSDIVYSQRFVSYSREELVARLQAALKKKRFEHVLRVEQTAIELAEQYGIDVEKASIAALVHDYAKQRPAADFIKVIDDYHLDPALKDCGNAIWHGMVGWLLVKDELQINDIDILNAVKYHTVGNEYMGDLEQLVFMADYIEPNRDFTGVEEARKLTHQNLASGVRIQLQQTLKYLVTNNKPVFAKTVAAYNSWITKDEQK